MNEWKNIFQLDTPHKAKIYVYLFAICTNIPLLKNRLLDVYFLFAYSL
jgi:hypothetical protein